MKPTLTLILLTFTVTALAQCATDEIPHRDYHYPEGSRSGTLTIPVVFHVIHAGGNGNISDEQILSGLDKLNEDFAEADFVFCLATQDPDANPSAGIIRINGQDYFPNYQGIALPGANCPWSVAEDQIKSLSMWDKTHAMPVYIVPAIASTNCHPTAIGGYAYLPGNSPWDAVVIRSDRIGTTGTVNGQHSNSGVFTHEVGHWFNLRHTFHNTQSCDGNPCNGDFVCDTPRSTHARTWNCGFLTNQGCEDALVGNFMDYDIICYNHFTEGQIDRMRAAAQGIHRAGLLDSPACLSVGCAWDLDGDGVVTVQDLTIMLSMWGEPYTMQDMLNLLAAMGCTNE